MLHIVFSPNRSGIAETVTKKTTILNQIVDMWRDKRIILEATEASPAHLS